MQTEYDAEYDRVPKAELKPRKPGESLRKPEVVLKRRDRNLQHAAERAAQIAQYKRGLRSQQKGSKIKRPEALIRNSIGKMKQHKRVKFLHIHPKPKMEEGKSLIVIRNGRLGANKKVKFALRELGLRKRHTAVFQLNSDAVTSKLDVCSPYVLWGCPDFKMIFNLIHKKVAIRSSSSSNPVMLSDNALIEEHLGEMGMLCTEDLAHALYAGTSNASDLMSRLEPIRFKDIRRSEGMMKASKFVAGDLKSDINDQLRKLMGE